MLNCIDTHVQLYYVRAILCACVEQKHIQFLMMQFCSLIIYLGGPENSFFLNRATLASRVSQVNTCKFVHIICLIYQCIQWFSNYRWSFRLCYMSPTAPYKTLISVRSPVVARTLSPATGALTHTNKNTNTPRLLPTFGRVEKCTLYLVNSLCACGKFACRLIFVRLLLIVGRTTEVRIRMNIVVCGLIIVLIYSYFVISVQHYKLEINAIRLPQLFRHLLTNRGLGWRHYNFCWIQ